MTFNHLGKWYFFIGQHCPVVAGKWLGVRSEFFGPKFSDFGLKIRFCYGTPIFVNCLFVALSTTVILAPLDRIFELRPFSWGEPCNAAKSLPHPTVGAPSASNSPSALSARAGQHVFFQKTTFSIECNFWRKWKFCIWNDCYDAKMIIMSPS